MAISNVRTHEHQLASNAALYLRAFAGAMRIASSAKRTQAEADLTSHITLGPDAIDAMVEALHRCLDELPQGGVCLAKSDLRSCRSWRAKCSQAAGVCFGETSDPFVRRPLPCNYRLTLRARFERFASNWSISDQAGRSLRRGACPTH